MAVGECDAKGYDLRTRRQGLRSSRDPDVKRLEGRLEPGRDQAAAARNTTPPERYMFAKAAFIPAKAGECKVRHHLHSSSPFGLPNAEPSEAFPPYAHRP